MSPEVDPQRPTFGQRLRATREGLGLSERELASAMDVSRFAISKIEGGTRQPSQPLREKLISFIENPQVEERMVQAKAKRAIDALAVLQKIYPTDETLVTQLDETISFIKHRFGITTDQGDDQARSK